MQHVRKMKAHLTRREWLRLAMAAATLGGCAGNPEALPHLPPGGRTIDDVSRLNATRVRGILPVQSEAQAIGAFELAARENLPISLAGTRHSQGGHIAARQGLVLDLRGFNRVLALNPAERTVRVQPGATWKAVQDAANPHGLAVSVMQSSNIFTVGGSIAANVHGRDPNHGALISTIRALRVLLPGGEVVRVSREEHPALFPLVVGGFGLFGLVVEAELTLEANAIYQKQTTFMDYREYPAWFDTAVRGRSGVGLHYARLSIAGDSLLREMYATAYHTREVPPEMQTRLLPLREDEPYFLPNLVFGNARHSDWGKHLSWSLQKRLLDPAGEGEWTSRNNAMRPPIRFLHYDAPEDTDVLQEYYIPVERFVAFVDGLRALCQSERINLLNLTVRHSLPDAEAMLSYAPRDSFALVLYINLRRSQRGRARAARWTRKLVDLAHSHGGTYYLTYQGFPTRAQMRKVYPQAEAFFRRKREVDPKGRLSNRFYEDYA